MEVELSLVVIYLCENIFTQILSIHNKYLSGSRFSISIYFLCFIYFTYITMKDMQIRIAGTAQHFDFTKHKRTHLSWKLTSEVSVCLGGSVAVTSTLPTPPPPPCRRCRPCPRCPRCRRTASPSPRPPRGAAAGGRARSAARAAAADSVPRARARAAWGTGSRWAASSMKIFP